MEANERDANAAQRAEVAALLIDATVDGAPEVVTSPSGRFRLTIQSYRTVPDDWSYTRGTVVRIADGVTACDIERNYGMFHHTFVEKDGR